ncbi:hypothetical protein V8C35DRAFT_329274 [Trichoderma chlorosporum]
MAPAMTDETNLVEFVDETQRSWSIRSTISVMESHTHGHKEKLTKEIDSCKFSSRDMELASSHRDHIVRGINTVKITLANTYMYVKLTLRFKRQRSDDANSGDNISAEATSRILPITVIGYSNSSKGELMDDGDEVPSQEPEQPRRSLANCHMPPPHSSDDEDEDDEDGDGDGNLSVDDVKVIFVDFSDCVFEACTGLNDSSVSDDAGRNPSADRQPSSSQRLPHETQSGLQDATFSAYFRILNARVQSGKREESCCYEEAQPALREEDENSERSTGNGDSGDETHRCELGDFVIVDREEADEEDMTDSCLNLVSHLDYVMFPTAEVLEFLRGGEMEVLEDVDGEETTCRRFLGEEHYDENNKGARNRGVGESDPMVVQMRSILQDVTRRLHQLTNGC